MNRKDTILIAVLVNAGLLAVLFITAVIYDTDHPVEEYESVVTLSEAPEPQKIPETPLVPVQTPTGDQVDNVLKFYEAPEAEPTPAVMTESEVKIAESKAPLGSDMVEITVKKGDSLDKLAKANNTTVAAIKKANSLVNERLSIGQVLRIPVGKKKAIVPVNDPVVESQYYVIKPGDNPWKIAKQFNLKYEEILRLNNMDEDKAKNLKAGDRIRIK